jgi:hypothetical protein
MRRSIVLLTLTSLLTAYTAAIAAAATLGSPLDGRWETTRPSIGAARGGGER